MNSAQTLKEQLAALESETANAIKAAKEKMLALDAQIEKQRIQEILQGRTEVQAVMKKYNLTENDILSTAPPVIAKEGVPTKSTSYLGEIRAHFNKT
jgi:DNA-binding protein H-NS